VPAGPRSGARVLRPAVRVSPATGTEEAMNEEDLPTQQPPAGETPRVPPSDVDPGRPGHPEVTPAERPPPAVGLIWRVDRRDTFQALSRARRRREGPITISWVPGDSTEAPRVAYTIGRKVGPAVVRNLLRRRIRMIIRETTKSLNPGAYLIGVAPAAATLSYAELRVHVLKALERFERS
jgi:ribonuclease P protein component